MPYFNESDRYSYIFIDYIQTLFVFIGVLFILYIYMHIYTLAGFNFLCFLVFMIVHNLMGREKELQDNLHMMFYINKM